MRSRVQLWGNSLAVRIPKAFASQAQLSPGAEVEVTLDGDRIVLTPVPPAYSLDGLLEAITADNLHGEVDAGEPVGNEAW